MKNRISMLLAWVALLPAVALCQKSAVEEAFKKYHVSYDVLNPDLPKNSLEVPCNLKRTVTTDNGAKIYLSSYDPTKSGLSRWTLQSVNSKPPSRKELEAFDKEHSEVLSYRIDENTLKVTKDDGRKLYISYQYQPGDIDEDHSFLKDCLFTAVIDIASGKLEAVTQKNLKNLKIKIVKVVKLTGDSRYQYSEKLQKYLLQEAEVVVVAKVLGMQTPITTRDVYSY
jgi:hypothetical protein